MSRLPIVFNSRTKKSYSTILSVKDPRTNSLVARLDESLSNFALVITVMPIDYDPIMSIVNHFGDRITKIVLPPMILNKTDKCRYHFAPGEAYYDFLCELFIKTPNCRKITLADKNWHDYQNARMYIIDGNFKFPNYLTKLDCLPTKFFSFTFSGKFDEKLKEFIRKNNISEFKFKSVDESMSIKQINDSLAELNLARLQVVPCGESW